MSKSEYEGFERRANFMEARTFGSMAEKTSPFESTYTVVSSIAVIAPPRELSVVDESLLRSRLGAGPSALSLPRDAIFFRISVSSRVSLPIVTAEAGRDAGDLPIPVSTNENIFIWPGYFGRAAFFPRKECVLVASSCSDRNSYFLSWSLCVLALVRGLLSVNS